MFKLTIKSIRSNPARFFLTGVAVILGVAFMAGTLVLTDTIKKSYDNVAVNVYKSTDALVRSDKHAKNSSGAEVRGPVDASLLASVRSAPGVQAAEPQRLPSARHRRERAEKQRAFSFSQAHGIGPAQQLRAHAGARGQTR